MLIEPLEQAKLRGSRRIGHEARFPAGERQCIRVAAPAQVRTE